MSISRIIATAAMALCLTFPTFAETTATTLTNSNGLAAGKALLSLYTQYKADGKLDMTNTTNITNLATLAKNIQGLTKNTNVKNFLTGLISGSKNLVNNDNSTGVLSSLTSIAGLDLSSITSSVATSAAKGLMSKLGGSTSTSTSTSTASGATTTAANALTKLFKSL